MSDESAIGFAIFMFVALPTIIVGVIVGLLFGFVF